MAAPFLRLRLRLQLQEPVSDEYLPQDLRGARFLASSRKCWLVYEKNHEFSLWNARTSDLITLPPLPDNKIHDSFLCAFSCPPNNLNDSVLILLDWNTPRSILRWRFGDEFWTRHQIKDDSSGFLEKCPDDDNLAKTVTFDDGRFFGLPILGQDLYMIDLNSPDPVSVVLASNSVPVSRKKPGYICFRYMLESCGELYLVYLVPGGFKCKEIVSVEVFKFNPSSKEWSREKHLGDKEFFVSDLCSFSCTSLLKPNHVCFIHPWYQNLCAFNMDDKTISVRPPLEDLPPQENQVQVQEEDFAPPLQWTGHDDNLNLQPWLMYWEKGESVCNLISPICPGQKYVMDIPNNDVTPCCSREGWCLMFREGESVFLWNPFARETIHLPKWHYEWKWGGINGCTISPSLDWVVLARDLGVVETFVLRDGEWRSRTLASPDLRLDNVLTFCNGTFYSFSKSTFVKLVSFTITEGATKKKVLSVKSHDKLEMPCSNYHQVFLLELDKKLLSVFVDFSGEWVRIFQLDDSNMAWIEVEDLGNHTIYVNSNSSFSITTPPGLENRVYFPRYHTKKKDFVYYSLASKMLHTHTTNEVLKNFYDTEEQLYSIWIEPKSS